MGNNDRRIESSKGFVRNRKARCMCKRDENRVIRTDVRGDETYRESVCYLTPSQMTVWGEVMPVGDRMKLLKDAAREDMLIIEDDYNSEFRYYNRPTPSLQGFPAGGASCIWGHFQGCFCHRSA